MPDRPVGGLQSPPSNGSPGRASTWITAAAALGLAAAVLIAAAQPIFTEDAWWHLAMGRAYAQQGLRLDADPLLHTALAAPAPAAWLADLALFSVERVAGFQGLRVAHALCVVAIFAMAFACARAAGASRATAWLGVAVLAVLGAYRLFQLRPHLFSMFAALAMLWLLLARGEPPSWRRVGAAALLQALWVNVHAAFVLGPLLIAAALAGLLALQPWRAGERRADARRARRLLAAGAVAVLATLANPDLLGPWRPYFAAGVDSPSLEIVADEWSRLDLFAWPRPGFPPSPLAWLVIWSLLVATPLAIARGLRRRGSGAAAPDPALAAVGLLSLGLGWFAVRFVWMGFFALLPVAQGLRGAKPESTAFGGARAARAALAAALAAAFPWIGAWPMISQGVHPLTYARPYPAAKYHAHAVWFMRDTGLRGRLWNDYATGNFLGYWLAPGLLGFVNGSLNVPPEVMDARHRVRRLDPGWRDALERYGVDVFFGTGVPLLRVGRPDVATTAHLEGEPGWIPIFRNLRSAVYLRRDPRDAANLERVADYYAEAGVPFDRERGFDPKAAIDTAPQWAFAHGLIPGDYPQLIRTGRTFDPNQRNAARDRLAATYALLGLYRGALEIDDARLLSDPRALAPARRRLWLSMRMGDRAAVQAAADALAAIAEPYDTRSLGLVDAARRWAAASADEAAALAAALPLLSSGEARALLAQVAEAEARTDGPG